MPFKNISQEKACWAQKKRNPKSKWNCKHWEKETKKTKRWKAKKPKPK